MTAGKRRTIWLLCLHACPFFLLRQAVSCDRRPGQQRPCRMDHPCVCVREGGREEEGVGWAMDVQSIMVALGSGEVEVVSEESALFEYSRSIIRTRATERLSGCRRRTEQLPPLGREQCADQEKRNAWGLVRILSFRRFRGSTVSKRGLVWSVMSCC